MDSPVAGDRRPKPYAYRPGLAEGSDFVVVRIEPDGSETRLCTLVARHGLHDEDDARRLVRLLNGEPP